MNSLLFLFVIINHIIEFYAIYKRDSDFLVAADSLVVVPGVMTAGKPTTLAEAHHMFEIFSKQPFLVVTGVFLYCTSTKQSETYYSLTTLTMKPTNTEERTVIFEKVTPLDKAGGFSLLYSPELFPIVEGSRSNVTGLPLETLPEHMQRLRK